MAKTKNLQLKEMKLKDIQPADYNPRKELKPGDEEYEKIKKSIEAYGLVIPLVYNEKTGNLVGGHQRYNVLNDLGHEKALVSVISVNEEDEKKLNIGLNNIKGEWNVELLKDVFEMLDTGEKDLELSGFSIEEIEDLMTQVYQEFGDGEIDLDDFEDDQFQYECPECGFHFDQ